MKTQPGRRRGYLARLSATTAALAMLLLTAAYLPAADDTAVAMRSAALLGRVYAEITGNYVEKTDPVNLMKAGIRGMLAALDPYSTYVDAQEKAELDMLTFGRYGGVGVSISNRGGKYLITALVDDRSASSSELRIGDEILRIDTVRVEGVAGLDLRRLLRGSPGSTLRIMLRRPGVPGTRLAEVVRREVPVAGLGFIEKLGQGVLYLKVDRFTTTTAEETRAALESFLQSRNARGIVIDLRDNPGGLLDAAVDMLELLTPRGSLLVSTRGRHPAYTREYRSNDTPLSVDIPLVVLVNESSASASEIVAGAVQDLDRGVILGTKSFGKGLVQSVLPLDGDNALKLTTSKYYTPSGRCIQRNDYGKRGIDGVLGEMQVDSMQTYRTLVLRRPIRGAGGITPDIIVDEDTLSPFLRQLGQSGALIQFAAERINRGALKTVPPVNASMHEAFRRHIDTLHAFANTAAEKNTNELLVSLKTDGYPERIREIAVSFSQQLRASRPNRVEQNRDRIGLFLRREFAFQLGGAQLRFRATSADDMPLQRALSLFEHPEQYQRVLRRER